MNLMLVETPAQAKRLSDLLGSDWRIEACHGWLRDLPADRLGVDLKDDFRPTFAVQPGRAVLLRRLLRSIQRAEVIYAATPPTRHGEAMAWHLLALSPDLDGKPIHRVTLSALTEDAVHEAIANPRPLDLKQVEAATAQRILDRLTAFGIAAQADKRVGSRPNLPSAALVALRVLADHRPPVRRWTASVSLKLGDTKLDAQVCNPKGKPLRLHSPEQADQLKRLLSAGVFWAAKSVQGKQPTPAPAILTLPVLMAEASRELGLKPVRTLHLLDLLYTMGWINHPATNPLADQTPAAVGHIVAQYGRPYLGHILPTREGIGPTDVARLPESVPGDGAALYGLIWRRFVAAHMAPAVDRVFTAAVQVGASQDKRYPVVLRLTASLPFFEGWRRVFMGEIPAGTPPVLPSLTHGQTLEAAQISLSERTTPPLDESAALALLSAFGMDIPTAADTLTTLRAADLLSDTPEVRLTDAGKNWAAFLADHFGALTDPTAAAERAADLDRIAAEEVTCSEVLTAFWSRFGQSLRPAKPAAPRKRKPLLLHPITETNR